MSQTETGSDRRRHRRRDADCFRRAGLEEIARTSRKPKLSAEEQASSRAGRGICGMPTTGRPRRTYTRSSPNVWQYVEGQGLPRHDYPQDTAASASRHRALRVVMKLAIALQRAAVTVMVPNSLGTGRTRCIRHRRAEEPLSAPPRQGPGNPCFALTSPEAGSDAARFRISASSARERTRQGDAGHAPHLGKALHHARSHRDAPRPRVQATIRKTPREKDIGITCALVPTNTPASISADATCR